MSTEDIEIIKSIIASVIEQSVIQKDLFIHQYYPKEDYYGISMKGSGLFFQIRKEDDYFSVRTNPRIDGKHQHVTKDLKNLASQWDLQLYNRLSIAEVRSFGDDAGINLQIPFPKVKLSDIKDDPGLKEKPPANLDFDEFGTSFSINNESVKGVIGVKEQTMLFAEIITKFSPDEKGMFIGLFGRWGRGKTFFWHELKNALRVILPKETCWSKLSGKISEVLLKENDYTENIRRRKGEVDRIIPVEFHAWKYQDTPAVWAYLYEVLADKYYDTPIFRGNVGEIIKRIIKSNRRRFLHSFHRNGWKLIFSFVLSVALAYFLFIIDYKSLIDFFINQPENTDKSKLADGTLLDWMLRIIGLISPFISWLYLNRQQQARDFFKQYFKKISYKQLLGIQAEIQKEISTLLRAWIGKNQVGKEKVLLFVDDIDRCSEEKIIQIIESIKVMLDDEEISKRLIVLAAIDENILKHAIQQKFYHLHEKDNIIKEEEKIQKIKTLTREHIDKLFIIGLKLGELNREEKSKILETYTDGRVFISNKSLPNDYGKDNQQNAIVKSERPSNTEKEDINTDNSTINSFSGNYEYEIHEEELDRLKRLISYYQKATPRAIRIFYYRYLLAKNLIDIELSNKPDLRVVYDVPRLKELLPLLIIKYSSNESPDDLIEFKNQFNPNQEVVEVNIHGKSFSVNPRLYLILLKITEMVVPY